MAEVERVSAKMQFDIEGGRVRATYEMAVEGNKAVASFTSEIAVTKADELGNKQEATGSFTSEIAAVTTKSNLGNNKEATGSVTGEMGAAQRVFKEGDGMVTEDRWITYVFLTEPPAWFKPTNTEPPATGDMITKEVVPDALVDILKDRPLRRKMPPVDKTLLRIWSRSPELLESGLSIRNGTNYCIDLHADILRQLNEKGFAEVGVDFTDGVKKVFILPGK